MKTKEFGVLATNQEQMFYMIIQELKELNKNLKSLAPKEEKKKPAKGGGLDAKV
jgi:hypothetical protein